MNSRDEAYQERKALLECARGEAALGTKGAAASLDRLISLMKARSAAKPYLSSLYFAGADVDHPYFLHNDKVAIGLSVLPEDAEKAGKRKRHPHQVEIIIVLQGQLCLHVPEKGKAAPVVLTQGDEYVIPKNACHWITPVTNTSCAYLFIKTNPAQEPRGVDC